MPALRYWTAKREADVRRLAADGKNDQQIADAIGAQAASVKRFRNRAKIPLSRDARFEPTPSDFARLAPTMTKSHAGRHWRASRDLVERWARDAGISFREHVRTRRAPVAKEQPQGPTIVATRPVWGGVQQAAIPSVPATVQDQAAHYLRKHYRQVCRLTTIQPKAQPGVWVVGRQKMPEVEMIELARKHGFETMAWAA